MKLILLLLLLIFDQIQGSTEMIQKFLPTGERSSICFSEDNLPKNYVVSLFYNSNITIGTCYCDEDPKLMTNFTGKVELSCPTSLIFPSPQKSDCGVYSARVTGDRIQTIKYKITFQDPVSPVELKVHPISDSSCEFKATCSSKDDEINDTLRCDDKSCLLVGGEKSKVTKSGASLRLYVTNESIICNHSNQVSLTQNKSEIQLCLRPEVQTTLIVVVTVGLPVVIIVGVLYCLKKKKLLCFAQRQTVIEDRQMLPKPPQVNGDPHIIPETGLLMDESIADSAV